MNVFSIHRAIQLAAVIAVVALDRGTKAIVDTRMAVYESIIVIPGFFDLTYVRNPGGVFGLFRNLDTSVRGLLFTVVPVAAIVLIAVYALRLPANRLWTQSSLTLILGGALGNLYDRFRFGYVIDFLDFYWRSHHWPAFNVADSAICVGVAILIGETLLGSDHEPGAARDTP